MNRILFLSTLLFTLPAFSQIADTADATTSLAKGATVPDGKLVGGRKK